MQAYIRILALVCLGALNTCAPASEAGNFEKRVFDPTIDGRWIGNGISYGAYRDGEGPGDLTSRAHIVEDLRILLQRWNLIRLYESGKQSRNILESIRNESLPMRVMLGAWISAQQSEDRNRAQIEGAIRLANEFSDIVVAVNVGNEIFVDWSAHRIDDMEPVIGWIREVRGSIRQPVTVNDDYNFWNKPEAGRIAAEVDFIGLHAYAFWNDKPLDGAMYWTEAIYRDIQQRYPDHRVALCETGWPTSRVYDDGSYEGGLVGEAGEAEQATFFARYDDWANRNRVVSLYFEAFDERWKGGFDGVNAMDKAEKHWGLFDSARRPKAAIAGAVLQQAQ